jgi:hypothetical protein
MNTIPEILSTILVSKAQERTTACVTIEAANKEVSRREKMQR